ncbi:c-type cytochrome [Marinobacterium weihaiense]|uniref:Cytochrome c n=1 Tax=Marinobacterium weihaiense TaxID=2851016 RepID=A0ABS6M886_9GAMM|nr:cytochrome c [Marinobacterium weihaiense]MBV0932455.1 cytochrome c [Marinobacterium weihaiense]
MWRLPSVSRKLLLTAMVALLGGCGEPAPESLTRGDELYDYYCRNCHQQKGLGPFLEQLPLTSTSLKRHEISLLITRGYPRRHHDMPVFSQLSLEQADALAHFILQQRRRNTDSR